MIIACICLRRFDTLHCGHSVHTSQRKRSKITLASTVGHTGPRVPRPSCLCRLQGCWDPRQKVHSTEHHVHDCISVPPFWLHWPQCRTIFCSTGICICTPSQALSNGKRQMCIEVDSVYYNGMLQHSIREYGAPPRKLSCFCLDIACQFPLNCNAIATGAAPVSDT